MADEKPRPREALPKNLEPTFAYCNECSPKLPLGVGGFIKAPSHTDKTGKLHTATMVKITAGDRIAQGESLSDFLARMLKKYAK